MAFFMDEMEENGMHDVRYAFLKPTLDAHTLGITAAADLVRDCGYEVLLWRRGGKSVPQRDPV